MHVQYRYTCVMQLDASRALQAPRPQPALRLRTARSARPHARAAARHATQPRHSVMQESAPLAAAASPSMHAPHGAAQRIGNCSLAGKNRATTDSY